MPGYYIHLAACNPKARENNLFRIGVEVPDLLKTYYELGVNAARIKYNQLKIKGMPPFNYFLLRLNQKEVANKPLGMHYGLSSDPNVLVYWQNLTLDKQQNAFFQGYLWHLLTDLLIYTYLDWDTKLKLYTKYQLGTKEQAISLLHQDWDKTNKKIQELYPNLTIPPEIAELNIIHFLPSQDLTFIDLDQIIKLINFLAQFNPIEEDINNIIPQILNKVEDYKRIRKQS